MGYIERNLADGERVVYQTKLHPVIFVWPALFFLIACAGAAGGIGLPAQILLWPALFALLVIFSTYLRSEFAVTNRRVVGRIAVGRSPAHVETPLIELREAEFRPGMLRSLLDYGTVVMTDRQGGRRKIRYMPSEFCKHLQARHQTMQRVLRQ